MIAQKKKETGSEEKERKWRLARKRKKENGDWFRRERKKVEVETFFNRQVEGEV